MEKPIFFDQDLHSALGLNTSSDGYHAMIDIETGGHPPMGAILEVAVVGFHPKDPTRVGPIYYAGVSEESNEAFGLTIDEDTRGFWEKQPRYEEVFGGERNIAGVVEEVDGFLAPFEKVWAKSPIFDLALVRDAMMATGYCGRSRDHWSFINRRRFRDLRTALDINDNHQSVEKNPDLNWPYERCHHPIADALKQIGDLYESGWAGPHVSTTAVSPPVGLEVIRHWRSIINDEIPRRKLDEVLIEA